MQNKSPPRFINFIFFLCLWFLLATGGFLFGYWVASPGPLTQGTTVLIEPGAGLSGAATALKTANVISNEWLFESFITVTGNRQKIKAGEYAFDIYVPLLQVIQKFARGEILIRRITVIEGWTSKQIVAALQENQFLTGDIQVIPAEGTLMPDTYNFTRGQSRRSIITRMETAMSGFIAAHWPERGVAYPLPEPQDWVKLASIVEAETPKRDERARVAGVYLNRLALPMRLEADPTVSYGINEGAGPLGRALTLADLQNPHAFNTYVHDGLPPTPINNPGRASLLAALHPERNNYFYFVANGTGGHAFAESFEQHQKNVAAWRKIKATP